MQPKLKAAKKLLEWSVSKFFFIYIFRSATSATSYVLSLCNIECWWNFVIFSKEIFADNHANVRKFQNLPIEVLNSLHVSLSPLLCLSSKAKTGPK